MWREVGHVGIAPGMVAQVRRACMVCRPSAGSDFPDRHNGTIIGLAEKSIRWHRQDRTADVQRVADNYGRNTEVANPPIPLPEHEGIKFLGTVGDICQEEYDMQHCIASYVHEAINGYCYLFHVEHGGEAASVKVNTYGRIVQAHGPRNGRNQAVEWGKRHLSRWGAGLMRRTRLGRLVGLL